MSEKKKVLLRIDQEIYEVVKEMAKNENRSINGQIENIISKSVSDIVFLKVNQIIKTPNGILTK